MAIWRYFSGTVHVDAGDLDPRPAAEIMRDVVMPIMGPVVGVLGQYHAVEPAVTDWNMYANPAGPRASQIFSAAVMREQVDPA